MEKKHIWLIVAIIGVIVGLVLVYLFKTGRLKFFGGTCGKGTFDYMQVTQRPEDYYKVDMEYYDQFQTRVIYVLVDKGYFLNNLEALLAGNYINQKQYNCGISQFNIIGGQNFMGVGTV